MLSKRQAFLSYLAPTSGTPVMLEIEKAKGVFMYDIHGKDYLDLIAGVSVSYLGHSDQRIISAVTRQAEKHLHLMVYGELVQSPQVEYAELLAQNLPPSLQSIYFVNSGAEAIEGAMKLAKKITGRSRILAFRNAYHGSTQGALSILGDEHFKTPFRPLLPDIGFLDFNDFSQLENINNSTACVFAEIIQAEAGVLPAAEGFLEALRKRCNETGALLVFDEIQTGFGRIGERFGHQACSITPDILVLAKSLGGGLPLGAFISSRQIMKELSHHPALGHITTFGGHPLSCAAGQAAFNILISENLPLAALEKEKLFRSLLIHPAIREIRGRGLFLAMELGNSQLMHRTVEEALKQGILTDWFLFCDTAIRITPALNISPDEIQLACERLLEALDKAVEQS